MALRHTKNYWQQRGNRIQTPPAVEPVTPGELRTHLRGVTDAMLPDAEANAFITRARQHIEDMTGIAMIDQSWLLAIDQWPSGREPWWDGVRQASITVLAGPVRQLELPRYPLASVDEVRVYGQNDTVGTLVDIAATFYIDTYREPGRMTLQSGATWPVALRTQNAIEITYTSGYGATAADVPETLKGAILQMAAYLFEHRGDGCTADRAYKDSGAAELAGGKRVMRI